MFRNIVEIQGILDTRIKRQLTFVTTLDIINISLSISLVADIYFHIPPDYGSIFIYD